MLKRWLMKVGEWIVKISPSGQLRSKTADRLTQTVPQRKGTVVNTTPKKRPRKRAS